MRRNFSQFPRLRKQHFHLKSQRGFTIIELMTTVVVAAVILALGVPSLVTFVKNNALAAASNQLVAGLAYARSEAVKRDTTVCVCPSSDGSTCGTTNWALGWIIYPQATSTSTCGAASSSIQTYSALPSSGMTLTSNSSTAAIGYKPDGSLVVGATVDFNLCDVRGATFARNIEISAGGRTLIATKPGYSVGGTALSCP